MPYVFQTKDKSGKTHSKWRFQYKDYQGVKKTGTGFKSKLETIAIAEKIEAEHLLIRNGYKEAPKKSKKHLERSFMEVAEEYLCWGRTQGGRGGKPWSPIHAKMRESHLKKWQGHLKKDKLKVLSFCLPKVEKVIQNLYEENKSGKTIANFIESLRSFCNFCLNREYIESDPLNRHSENSGLNKCVNKIANKLFV